MRGSPPANGYVHITSGRPPHRENPMSGPEHPIDTSLFDAATAAADDFYRHVNGGWIDANPVPPQYGSWGPPRSCTAQPGDPARAARGGGGRGGAGGSAAQMVGDYYAAAMDEEAIAAAGLSRSRSTWAGRGSRVRRRRARPAARPAAHGVEPALRVGIAPDFEDPDAYLVYLGQGGLGLPERDYYLRDDEQSVALRAQYTAHVASSSATSATQRSRRAPPPSASLRSRPGWPSRPTPPPSCATCSSR